MNAWLHSPFLQALGYAIIHSLWQFALLWLLYFVLNSLCKLSPHQKYTTGLVLELAGFSWFAGTFVFYFNQCRQLAKNVAVNQPAYLNGLLNNTATSVKQKFFFLILNVEQFFPYLSLAYLALLVVLIGRWLYAYNYSRKVRSAGILSIDESWQLFVHDLSMRLGINRSVQIYLSEVVKTPLTVGFFKPFILIPLATINYLNTQQMEAVIVHELAHIRRFDYLFNLLLALIEASLFYNPFMQLIHQQIKKERENCCDDWVMKYEYSPSSYARALLQIASHQTNSPLLALKASDNKQLLVHRIKRITEKKEHSFFNYQYQLLALLVMTFVFSLLSFLSPSKKGLSGVKSTASSNIVFEPMAAKVRNPLFNPVFFLADSVKTIPEVETKKEEISAAKQGIIFNESSEGIQPVVEEENNGLPQITPITPAEVAKAITINCERIYSNNNTNFEVNHLLKDTIAVRFGKPEVEKWLAPEAPKHLEIYFKRAEKDLDKEADFLSLEKVKVQIQNVFERIKPEKKTIELGRLQALVRAGIERLEGEKLTSSIALSNEDQFSELEKLEKKITYELDSLNHPKTKIFITGYSSNLSYNFQLPAVVYNISPAENYHRYSYEYSDKNRARVVCRPAMNDTGGSSKRRERVADIYDEDDMATFDELPPPPPPSPINSKGKAIFIIKI